MSTAIMMSEGTAGDGGKVITFSSKMDCPRDGREGHAGETGPPHPSGRVNHQRSRERGRSRAGELICGRGWVSTVSRPRRGQREPDLSRAQVEGFVNDPSNSATRGQGVRPRNHRFRVEPRQEWRFPFPSSAPPVSESPPLPVLPSRHGPHRSRSPPHPRRLPPRRIAQWFLK